MGLSSGGLRARFILQITAIGLLGGLSVSTARAQEKAGGGLPARPTTESLCRALIDYSLEPSDQARTAKELLDEQLKIQGNIEWAANHLGRDSNLFEALRMRQIIRVRRYLVMRNAFQTAERLSYLFRRTLSGFYLTQFGLNLMDRLGTMQNALSAENAVEELLKLRRETQVKLGLKILAELDRLPARASDRPAFLEKAIDRARRRINRATGKHAKRVAERFDEYNASFSYLRKLVISSDSEEAKAIADDLLYATDEGDSGDVATKKLKKFTDSMAGILPESAREKAPEVLQRLSPGYLMGGYFKGLGAGVAPAFPKLIEFYRLIERFQNIEIHRLKAIRRRDMTDAILASGVGPIVIDALAMFFKRVGAWPTSLGTRARAEIDAVLKKLPPDLQNRQRENALRFRAAVRDARDTREYYFDIESIAHSYGTGIDKLNAMLSRNAGTDDLFMTIFARRIDLRDSWREMKEAAKNDKVNGKLVYQRMLAAEQRAIGRDLSLESYSEEMTILRRFFAWVRPLLAIGAGTWAYHQFWSEPLSPEEEEELKPKPRPSPRPDSGDGYEDDPFDDYDPDAEDPYDRDRDGERRRDEDRPGDVIDPDREWGRDRPRDDDRDDRREDPYRDWPPRRTPRRPTGRNPSQAPESQPYHYHHGLTPAEAREAEAFGEALFQGLEWLLRAFPETPAAGTKAK